MTEALRRLVEAVERLGRHRQCPICLYLEQARHRLRREQP